MLCREQQWGEVVMGGESAPGSRMGEICRPSWCGVLHITSGCVDCGIHERLSSGEQYLPSLQHYDAVGLTQDGGLSIIARICCSRTISFLGRISMSLYLVHMPVQSCLMIILRGPFPTYGDGSKNYCETRPVSLECYERFDKYFFLPWWGIIVSTVVSLIVAYFIERYVEAPMRNLLRMPSTQKPRAKPQSMAKPQPMETRAREQGVALKAE